LNTIRFEVVTTQKKICKWIQRALFEKPIKVPTQSNKHFERVEISESDILANVILQSSLYKIRFRSEYKVKIIWQTMQIGFKGCYCN